MSSIFNDLNKRNMITKEHIEAELNKLHTANGMTPNPLLNSDLGLSIINDLLKQIKNIAYEPVLSTVINEGGVNIEEPDKDGDFEVYTNDDYNFIDKEQAKRIADFIYSKL